MANFPASFDVLSNPSSGDVLTSPSHATQHATANDILEAIEASVGLTGTSFPGSPAAGDRFWRTDLQLMYYYSGAYWLSVNLYDLAIPTSTAMPSSATATSHRAMVPHAGVHDLWLVEFQAGFFVSGGTALSASHKWVLTLVKQPAATTIATLTINSGTLSAWRTTGATAISTLVETTNFEFEVNATKTGTPGDLYMSPSLTYRHKS